MLTESQCYNSCTLVGWLSDIKKNEAGIAFCLRQNANIEYSIKVVVAGDTYLPRFLKESNHPLVKLVGSMYSTEKNLIQITRPLTLGQHKWLSRPNIIEMPQFTTQQFINQMGECTPYLEWDAYSNLPNESQQKISNKLANSSGVAGWVSGKKMLSNDVLAINLEINENKIIPIRFYNFMAREYFKRLEFMQPLFVHGKLLAEKNTETGIVETYIKTINLTSVCKPGKHIPKMAPLWVKTKFDNFIKTSIQKNKVVCMADPK